MQEEQRDSGGIEELGPPVPIPLVVGRIVVVTSVGVSSSLGLFMLVAGWWLVGGTLFASTFLFIFLMFYIERLFGEGGKVEG